MPHDNIRQLIEGRWPDPDGGVPIGVETRAVIIERSLAGSEADVVRKLDLGRVFAVVSDPATREVLGTRIERALASLGSVVPVVLGPHPHADAETAAAIASASTGADTLVAVGSGTINDLCKHAAAEMGKPYIVFATAPSMNGYTSSNAAITVNGHKKSLPAKPAQGVFMDLSVLAAAPVRMIRAGLGDSLCRTTAQADWLMSHVLRKTGYRHAPFAILAADEPALLERSEALVAGDGDVMRHLARTLVLSGFGMSICGGSNPASQGEHLISHYLDTMLANRTRSHLHGEQVAVATLTMARIQERMLVDGPPRFTASRATRDMLVQRFGHSAGADCWDEFKRKQISETAAEQLNDWMARNWSDLVRQIEAIHISSHTLEKALSRAGAPTRLRDIGVSETDYEAAVLEARYLRDRFTFLDLAAETGRLEEIWHD
jgi:glycerol-1-phosphate dehydrogenase [NAD(P)+]